MTDENIICVCNYEIRAGHNLSELDRAILSIEYYNREMYVFKDVLVV